MGLCVILLNGYYILETVLIKYPYILSGFWCLVDLFLGVEGIEGSAKVSSSSDDSKGY